MQYIILIRDRLNYARLQILRHKIAAVFLAVVILTGVYYGYSAIFGSTDEVRYVTAAAEKGTLIVSITGSGQVSAAQQVDVKAKVSGDVTYVNVKAGQYVPAGTLIAQLDARDAQKSVRDAEINLENTKLSMEKLKQSSADLSKLTEDAFNNISDAFLDLPAVISGSETVINGSTLSANQSNSGFYRDFVYASDRDDAELFVAAASNDYGIARIQYDEVLALYKDTNRYTSAENVANLLNKTIEAARATAQTLKSEQNLLDYLYDYNAKHPERMLPTLVNTYRSNLQTNIGKVNGHLIGLINTRSSLRNVPLDISSQQLSVRQRENALLDAKEKLAEYYVRAPFGGIVAKLNVKVGDSSVSTIATLITKQKIAEISLNEIDVAKVKASQKVTLTFDAIPDLTITGQVAEVDAVGTVSQGVVTYTVKIGFDTQDDRVKTAMSVSAAIVIEAKPSVLLVPNSAVKSQGGISYVEIVDGDDRNTALAANVSGAILRNSPRQQPIEIGTASDEFTEILNGLNEGDVIVTRAIQATSAQSTQTQQQSGGLRIPGIGGGGGGFRGGGGVR